MPHPIRTPVSARRAGTSAREVGGAGHGLAVATALLVTAAAFANPAPAAGQSAADALAVLDRAAERYRSAGAVCADFRQELSVPLLNQRAEGTGRLCQKSPDLFSMRFAEPAGDLVVVDGASVWIYYPSRDAKQVIKAPISVSDGGRAIDFHREFLEDAARKYEVEHQGTERIGERGTQKILLRPRGDVRYREAVVWIDGERSLVRRVEVREENGSVRTIHLSNVDLSPTIPAGTFQFTPPSGTRVITP